jgi:hypothetical protein
MSWATSALWAAALGLLLLACGTGAQAWANVTEYRDLWDSVGPAASQAVQNNLSVPVLLWALRGGKGSPGSIRSQLRQMLDDAAQSVTPLADPVPSWRDLLTSPIYMVFAPLLPLVPPARLLWRLFRQFWRALVEIPRNMTVIRQAGGEEAARIAMLARMTVIWTVLMFGSLFILAGAGIQLALAYTSP